MDNAYLLERANFYEGQLKNHFILSKYWDKLSLILKGSTARGYTDEYSDIDFVIWCDDNTYKTVCDEYNNNGLTTCRDGVFLPLNDEWEGHYNLNTFADLTDYFDNCDIAQIWEYTNVKILSDPSGNYIKIIDEKLPEFIEKLPDLTMRQYLDLQLNLDWMRQPLRRADAPAALMYMTSVMQGVCRMAFLLEGKPYPCDKWLFYYFDRLGIHDGYKDSVRQYLKCFDNISAVNLDLDLDQYNQYTDAQRMLEKVIDELRLRYNDANWIDNWYLYV